MKERVKSKPLRKFKEQFKKSSFIIQEQDSKTGHELGALKVFKNSSSTFYELKIGHILKNNCS